MKIKKILLHRVLPLSISLVLALTCLSGCQKNPTGSSTEAEAENVAFETFTEELFREEVAANTINLHYTLEDPAALDITDYEVSLGDFSKEARESSASYLQETLSEVLSYDYDVLSLENRLTYDLLVDYLNTQLSLNKYELYYEPLAFSGGLQMELPILFAEYEFRSEQDVKDYLKMIALTDEYFDQIMDFEAEKSSKGLFMASDLYEKVIDSCEGFLEKKEDHYLISSFKSRLEKLDLSEQKKASYTRQNLAILEKQLFPAYEEMIVELEKLKNTGVNQQGICYLEDGDKYYELLVYSETGCEDSVDVIFRRIENQRMTDLIACSKIQSENTNIIAECSSFEWKIEKPEEMLTQLQSAILADFPAPPDCSYEIKYVEPELEEFLAPAFYIVAPVDHYEENVIYINNGHISADIYAFTTLAHEGYPGHLYQTVMTYAYEYPLIRSVLNYPGFSEGWATYTEMLSYDYAGVKSDVASFLSHNQAATLSLYASSDIGLHYYGWTYEEMKAFWEGYGITNEDVIKEITQLILSEPGNYLKYYIGYIEFLEFKEYAKELYGSEYSEKAFHQAILDIGPAPFAILEKYLSDYWEPQT